ncbi:MAG TPA: Ig-like domain-containing protein [Pirellulales bacterium]|jgi:hypothetical protein
MLTVLFSAWRDHYHPASLVIGAVAMLCCLGGCDSPGTKTSAGAASSDAPADLRLTLNQIGSDPATSVDLVGLAANELQAFAALDEAQRATVLQVFVGAQANDDLPPITGATTVVDQALRFTPRYPFGAGLDYRVLLNRPQLSSTRNFAEPVTLQFSTAPVIAPTAEIAHIYPTADQLPENQLKFYLHFSAPMSRGEAYRHIHLVDAEGRDMPAVFLELGEELWDRDMQRFTLLLDPGRVKRGLVPREELGPVLEAGHDYTLVIDADWPDAHGRPLRSGLRKSFHAGAADETPIDITAWQIASPAAGTRDPLRVEFPEPLDHALLLRVLHVTSATDEPIAGQIDVPDGETHWRFTPDVPWPAGEYRLVIETTLEDLAGNAVGRAFDVDTFGPIRERIETETVARPFVVSASE